MRILLIEDDLNFCETLRFQLEQEAYEVDVCHDGRDGLDLFLQDAHDIVPVSYTHLTMPTSLQV